MSKFGDHSYHGGHGDHLELLHNFSKSRNFKVMTSLKPASVVLSKSILPDVPACQVWW